MPRLRLEMPGNLEPAGAAGAVIEIPLAKIVPIALDQDFVALRAPRAAAAAVMDIPHVNIPQPLGQRDIPRACQRRGWRARLVEHLEVRMKRREMPRHIRP